MRPKAESTITFPPDLVLHGGHCMLGILWWTSLSSRGRSNAPRWFMLQKPEFKSTVCVGNLRLARVGLHLPNHFYQHKLENTSLPLSPLRVWVNNTDTNSYRKDKQFGKSWKRPFKFCSSLPVNERLEHYWDENVPRRPYCLKLYSIRWS